MIDDIIKYLKSVNIKVPRKLTELAKLENIKLETGSVSNKSQNYLNFHSKNHDDIDKLKEIITRQDIQSILLWVKKNISLNLFSYYKQNNNVSLDSEDNLLNLNTLNKYKLPIQCTVDKVLNQIKDTNFYENLQTSRKYNLWDLETYNGKDNEGQAIYIPELDLTFISLVPNNNLTDYCYLAHEVGHSYFNFMNHKYYLDQMDIIDTERQAYNFEISAMEKLSSDNILQKYIFNYLVEISLTSTYVSFMLFEDNQINNSLDKMVNNYYGCLTAFIPWIVEENTLTYDKVATAMSQQIKENTFNLGNVYYLLARLKAMMYKKESFLMFEPEIVINNKLKSLLDGVGNEKI